MKTNLSFLFLAIVMFFAGCNKDEISDLEDRVDGIETVSINELKQELQQADTKIATLKAELDALENQLASGDTDLESQLASLRADLETAQRDFTAACNAAIAAAIEANNEVIEGAIADSLNVARTEWQTDIEAINAQIATIGERLSALENRIYSLTYIPTHTDGKATMAYNGASGKWEAELSFIVTPKSVAGNIKQEDISAKGVYTATRAVNLIDLSVTAFESDTTNGTITVSVSGDNLTNFLSGTSAAAVFLIISDDNSEFVSDYVPLVLKSSNINAANMSADELKTAVSQDLNDGARNFTISGNLNEDQQKAVGTALRDWCGGRPGDSNNAEGQGTVSLTLPDVTEILANTFGVIHDNIRSYALKSVNLPNVTVIGDGAFLRNEYLQSVTAPKVTEVGNDAFGGCNALSDVDMPNVEKVGTSCFEYSSLTDFTFTNLKEIGYCAFRKTDLVTVDLAQVTDLEGNAFSLCNNLQSVTAPLLTEVLQWAFADCEKLTSLTFGKPITKWESQVLNNMTTENITLTLHPDQKVLTGGSNAGTDQHWTVANGAATVEFGTGKTFCGYTFKEIKKYEE